MPVVIDPQTKGCDSLLTQLRVGSTGLRFLPVLALALLVGAAGLTAPAHAAEPDAQVPQTSQTGPELTDGHLIIDERDSLSNDTDHQPARTIVYNLDADLDADFGTEELGEAPRIDGPAPDEPAPEESAPTLESEPEQLLPASVRVDDAAEAPLGTIRVCFDADVPQVVRAEAMAAVTQWERVLHISGPIIEIDFFWLNFANPNILGAAGPTTFALDPNLPHPQARYPIALANELLGIDHSERPTCDSAFKAEIVLVLNANAGRDDGGWIANETPLSEGDVALGTDLQTTILHELGHGFGFIGSAETNEAGNLAWPSDADSPLIYDLLTRRCHKETYGGCGLADSSPTVVGDLDSLTSGELWLDTGLGPLLEMEAPAQWDSGSSYSHLDEIRYPSASAYSLMTPYIERSQRLRAVDNAAAAVLQQIGWTLRLEPGPLASASIAPGVHRLELSVGQTDLSLGPPPTGYEIRILRLERDTDGIVGSVLAYQPLEGSTPTLTIQGVQNSVLYQVEIAGFGAEGLSDPVRSQAGLPLPNFADEAMATATYDALLGRPPVGDEARSFASRATNDGLGAALTHVFSYPAVANEASIARLYLGYLSRMPDHQGFSYWISQYRQGSPLEDLAFDFVLAANTENGPFDDDAFIKEVYSSVLGRDVEQAGLEYWLWRLADGTTRGRLLLEISDSAEHLVSTSELPSLLVAFESYRGRLPNSDEFELWLPIAQERGIGEVLAALALDLPGTGSSALSDS